MQEIFYKKNKILYKQALLVCCTFSVDIFRRNFVNIFNVLFIEFNNLLCGLWLYLLTLCTFSNMSLLMLL